MSLIYRRGLTLDGGATKKEKGKKGWVGFLWNLRRNPGNPGGFPGTFLRAQLTLEMPVTIEPVQTPTPCETLVGLSMLLFSTSRFVEKKNERQQGRASGGVGLDDPPAVFPPLLRHDRVLPFAVHVDAGNQGLVHHRPRA